jgi:aminopeptidase N
LSGREPLSDFLEASRKMTPDTNPAVLRLVTGYLRDLDERFDGLTSQAAFRQYVRQVLSPVFARVGWTDQPADSADVRLLRASLLSTLSQLADPQVVSEARSRFVKFREDPKSVSADQRQNILFVVAENADAATWDQLHDLARHSGSYLEQEQIYDVLGVARDPALAQQALALTLTDELPVTLRPNLVREVGLYHYPEEAFDFFATHLDQINEWLEPDSRNQFAPSLLRHSANAAMIPKLRAYAEAHIPPTARKDVVVAEAAIAYNVRIRTQQLPEIDQWLKSTH